MLPSYSKAIDAMQQAFDELERCVPAPQSQILEPGFVFRYQERSFEQALVLRLAALLSRLRAAFVLWDSGFVQEQAVMHRLVDEYNEDVTFLVLGMVKNQIEPAHIQFRDSLFAEDFLDPEDIVGSQQRRNLVPRRKIRAYIARVGDASGNPHREIEVAEAIGSAYSGFVHGAAPHVLDMYGGDPPRFHLNGMSNTPRRQQHLRDAWNYVYRTLLSFEAVAHAFEARQVVENVRGATEEFRRRSGRAS